MREERQHLIYEVLRRLRQGESQRGISRVLGIAPKTVRRILRDQAERREEGESCLERDLGPRRTPRGSKLDKHEPQIAAWLEEFPDLTAVRLVQKLRALGFDGRYTIVRNYLKKLRGSLRKKTAVQVVVTPVGQHYVEQEIMGSCRPFEPREAVCSIRFLT